MAILSKVHKPDNFESLNSLEIIFINIQCIRSNSVGNEYLLESNSPNILVRQTQRTYLVLTISLRIMLLICMIWQEGEISYCTRRMSRKLLGFLFMSLTNPTSFSVLLLFPMSITISVFVYYF